MWAGQRPWSFTGAFPEAHVGLGTRGGRGPHHAGGPEGLGATLGPRGGQASPATATTCRVPGFICSSWRQKPNSPDVCPQPCHGSMTCDRLSETGCAEPCWPVPGHGQGASWGPRTGQGVSPLSRVLPTFAPCVSFLLLLIFFKAGSV